MRRLIYFTRAIDTHHGACDIQIVTTEHPMTDLIAAAHEYIGSRRIPTDTQIRAWLRSLPRDTVAQIEAIVDAAIEASTDGAAAIAATESACLKLAPILLARR